MRDALLAYFSGEKQSGIAWGFAGLVSLAVALGIWRFASVYRAMLWPLVLFGLIQVGAALSVVLTNEARVARLEQQLQQDPATLHAAETKRIATLNTVFTALEGTWTVLFLVGAALIFLGKRDALFAVGLGLALEGAAMLTLDAAAARRSHVYGEALSRSKS